MIFGLSVQPGDECTWSTEEEVHLSLAAIESGTRFGDAYIYSQLILKTDSAQQLLCTLGHGVILQQCLDLKIMPGEKVTFAVQGSCPVFVTGYSHSSPSVVASDEPTVGQEDTVGSDNNNNDAVVKSEPDDTDLYNDSRVDEDTTNSNQSETTNSREQDCSTTFIKSEPTDGDCFSDDGMEEEMTHSNLSEVTNGRQEENNMELQIEQDNFAKSAEEMEPTLSAATPESDVSGERQVKKTKRMLEFEADEATSQQVAKKTPNKVQPGKNAEKTGGRKSSQAKADKLQDAIQRTNAQKAVYQQMFTRKRKVEKSAVEDQREVETSTLEKQVKELKAKLQVAQNRISELKTSRQKSSLPHLSVAVTPKKLQLIKDVYQVVESAADGGPSGDCTMGRRWHQMMPKAKPIGGQDRDPLPPTLTTEKLNTPSTSSEVLTPLYPGGKPMLPEKAKCIAFSKGKCKESLLYALLTAVFGIEVLARSNALGSRQAVNKVGHTEHRPLDQDKLHEIKGEHFSEPEESITTEKDNLPKESTKQSDAPETIEEDLHQKVGLVNDTLPDKTMENRLEYNDDPPLSKLPSISIVKLEIVGLSDHEMSEEENIISHEEDISDNNHVDVSVSGQSDRSGKKKIRPGQTLIQKNTSQSGAEKISDQCDSESTQTTKDPTILHPAPRDEMQERTSLHQKLGNETASEGNCVSMMRLKTIEKHKATSISENDSILKHCGKSANVETFPCEHCREVFRTKDSLTEHEKIHIEERPFVCRYCEKRFTSRSNLWHHRKVHTGDKPFSCNVCEKSFRSRRGLRQHEMVHTTETTFSCKPCEVEFSDRTNYLKHLKKHTDKKDLKCKYCEMTFGHSRTLMFHERIHTGEKSFKCSYCSKSFSRSKELRNHEMIHTGEKPFKCSNCDKSFNRKSTLNVHEKIHSGEKGFQCKHCGEMFRHKFTLVGHEKVHTQDEKQFKCEKCGKKFTRKTALKNHKWVHMEKKPFGCNYCNKTFARSHLAVRHEMIHTGVKPFQCKFCEKRFNQKVMLVKHERIHTGEMPFKCKTCDKEFACKSNCTSHERIHVTEKPS